jgi:hypothetical protein
MHPVTKIIMLDHMARWEARWNEGRIAEPVRVRTVPLSLSRWIGGVFKHKTIVLMAAVRPSPRAQDSNPPKHTFPVPSE